MAGGAVLVAAAVVVIVVFFFGTGCVSLNWGFASMLTPGCFNVDSSDSTTLRLIALCLACRQTAVSSAP